MHDNKYEILVGDDGNPTRVGRMRVIDFIANVFTIDITECHDNIVKIHVKDNDTFITKLSLLFISI